ANPIPAVGSAMAAVIRPVPDEAIAGPAPTCIERPHRASRRIDRAEMSGGMDVVLDQKSARIWIAADDEFAGTPLGPGQPLGANIVEHDGAGPDSARALIGIDPEAGLALRRWENVDQGDPDGRVHAGDDIQR